MRKGLISNKLSSSELESNAFLLGMDVKPLKSSSKILCERNINIFMPGEDLGFLDKSQS